MESPAEGIETNTTPRIVDGAVADIELLPKDLTVERQNQQNHGDDSLPIEVGPLEFDYRPMRDKVEKGESFLRVVKGESGNVLGFTVITPGAKNEHVINMLWVDPNQRKSGLGGKLLDDSVRQLPNGKISMDIWGGEPMIRLAQKHGFKQDTGGGMANRYSLTKQVTV